MSEKVLDSMRVKVGAMDDTYINNPKSVAGQFSVSKAYAAGDYVYYNRKLYCFTAAHAAGAWTGSDASEATVTGELSALKADLTELPPIKTPEETEADLYFSDGNGNVVAMFADGHVKTKEFDSMDIGDVDSLTTTEKTTLVGAINEVNSKPSGNNDLSVRLQSEDLDADFYVADRLGKGLVRFSDGNIQTKKFNSDQNEYKVAIDYTDVAGRGVITHFFPKGTDLSLHTVTGEVGSQYLSHNLLTYGYINKSGTAIQLGREYGFNYFHVHLPDDAAGVYVDYPANLLWHQSTTLYFSAFSEASFQRKPVIVTVSPDGTKDFQTLRTAVDAVAPYASDYTPYEIHMYPGTYDVLSEYSAEEIGAEGFVGIMITNGMKLIGIGKREEIVITAEMDTTEYDSTKRNDVSTLNIKGNVWLENLTIYATAIRYCIHDDYASPQDKPNTKTLRNLKLQGFNLTTLVFTYGAGGQGKTIDAKDCDFTNAFHVHNGNNPSRPYSVFLENCTAKRFTFADRDATNAPTRIYMNNCKAPFIEIRGSDTEHNQSLFVDGINVGDPMILCPPGYVYSVGKCDKFDDAIIASGYAVKFGATGNKVPAITTSLDDIYGISIGTEDGCTVVQYGGYISSNTLGISGLSIGDYLTIDTSTGAVISGGTSANAIAKVKYIDPDGVAYAKILL